MVFHTVKQRKSRIALLIPLLFISAQIRALEPVLDVPAVTSERASRSLLLDIATAGGRHIAVGERGHIVYSDDGGERWQQAHVPVSATLTAVYFATPQHGWAVGHSGVILATVDGGESWVKQFDGHNANRQVVAQMRTHVEQLEARMAAAGREDTETLEYQLDDARFALENAEIDVSVGASTPMLDVWFENANKGIAIGAYGYMFCTENGGKNWQNCASRITNSDRYHLNAIGQSRYGELYIVGEAGRMFSSNDGGEHWRELDSPYEGSLFGMTDTGQQGGVLVFGLRGHVFRSDDAGESWQPVAVETTATLSQGITHADLPIVLVGNAGVMLVSHDAGHSFTLKQQSDRVSMTAVAHGLKGQILLTGAAGVKVSDL